MTVVRAATIIAIISVVASLATCVANYGTRTVNDYNQTLIESLEQAQP